MPMLEKMREKSKGFLSWGIVILIGLTFAMWGVSDYFSNSFGGKYAAKVNGERLTWREVDANYERARRQKGSSGLSEKDLKEQVRLMLIQRVAMLSNARALGFQVSDEQLGDTLIQIPIFQVEGKFSKERYLEVLSSNGFSDPAFRKELEQDILLGQLEQGLTQTNFTLPSEVARVVELFDEQRNFGYFLLTQDKFKTGVELSKEDIANYYEKNKTNFILPEKVSVEYVELSLEQLAKQKKITDAELEKFYADHLLSYSAPERVRARHILISVPSKETEAEAKAKIEQLLANVKKGEDFGTLAKAHSDDKGSAKNGGDLGWFSKGQMVPVFEKAAFALKAPKDISEPIRSQYGFHIIQLVEHKQAETRPFNDVKELVLEQIQREKALALFMEQSEALSKLAFEKSNSLAPIAEELGLKIQSTGYFSRGDLGSSPKQDTDSTDASKIIENPFVVASAFSDAVYKEKNNSDPIQVGEYDLVVLRIKDNKPAVQQTLEESTKKIEARLLAERTKDKVKELAESIQKRISDGENPATMATNLNLPWNIKTGLTRHSTTDKDLNKDILAAVFKMPRLLQNNQDMTKAIPLPNGDYAIVALQKVTPGNIAEVEPAMQTAYRRSISDGIAQLEFSLYANQVLNDSRIEVSDQDAGKP